MCCKNEEIKTLFCKTPVGTLAVGIVGDFVVRAAFIDKQVKNSVALSSIPATKFQACGTEFERKVWHEVRAIPAGQTATYQEIAHAIGQPKAYRAVARALANNPIAYFIPCHRVIGSDGSLRGYAWGIEKKALLLAAEKSCAEQQDKLKNIISQ